MSQKYLYDEALKYTYFPEINDYDLIFIKNYFINDIPYKYSITEGNFDSNILNTIRNNNDYIKDPSQKIKNLQKNNSYSALTSHKRINFFSPKKIILDKNNNFYFTNKNMNYNSINKNKLSPLNQKEKEKNIIKIKNSK